jgi:hypothetical protein
VKATIVATIQHFVGGLIWDGFGKVCKRLLYIESTLEKDNFDFRKKKRTTLKEFL